MAHDGAVILAGVARDSISSKIDSLGRRTDGQVAGPDGCFGPNHGAAVPPKAASGAMPQAATGSAMCAIPLNRGRFIEYVAETAVNGLRPSRRLRGVARHIDPQKLLHVTRIEGCSPGDRYQPASISGHLGEGAREEKPPWDEEHPFLSFSTHGQRHEKRRPALRLDGHRGVLAQPPERGQGAGLGWTSRVVGPAVAQV
jgi:hypothetical protein